MRNYKCKNCEDTGKTGFIIKHTCSQCGGNPEEYFLKTFKKPSVLPPRPPPGKGSVNINIYLHK